jgi:hypothetical protein
MISEPLSPVFDTTKCNRKVLVSSVIWQGEMDQKTKLTVRLTY